jgi:predicted Zn-dependent protease
MSASASRRAASPMRYAALALLLWLAACSGTSQNGQVSLQLPQLTPPGAAEQATASAAEQRETARILSTYGGAYDNPRLNAMLEKMMDRLAAASDKPEQKYEVTLLNSPAINAFALPDGHLFVTRGLVTLANDKAELTSVLAHEMGHVIARHAQIREEKMKQVALANHVMTDFGNDSHVGALALAKSKLALASFSRAQEFEADGIGVGISARAGFDPYGASRFLADMQRKADFGTNGRGGEGGVPDFLANHPSTPARVAKVLADARAYGKPGSGERDRDAYLAELNGIVYGEDPSEGFVRGRRFLQPKLGFTFLAPPRFTLDNTAQAVTGLKTGGAEAMRLDVVSVPAEQSLADYLKSGWMENVDPASVADFNLNGFPAATATAAGKPWSFRLFVVRFGSDVYRFIFAAKTMTAQADRAFRQSVMSFRRMSLKEAREIKPLRVKIVTVGAHDTVASLARRMASGDHRLERFRVLNGLGPKDEVKPGEQVKIIR